MRLRDLHRFHRRRKIRARRHSIPDLIQIILQIRLELLDTHTVHPGTAPIGLYLPIGVPHFPLANLKRFSFRWLQPFHVIPPGQPRLIRRKDHERPDPFARPPLQRSSSLLRVGPPACPATVLNPSRLEPLGTLPLTTRKWATVSGACLPLFHTRAADQAHVASMPDTAWPTRRAPARLIPE